MANKGQFNTLLSAVVANGVSSVVNVDAFEKVIVQISTASSADATIQILGSVAASEPTFSNAATVANPWAPKFMVDQDTGSPVQGTTGVKPGGTDIVKEYELNTSAMRFLAAKVSSYVAGAITVKIRPLTTNR